VSAPLAHTIRRFAGLCVLAAVTVSTPRAQAKDEHDDHEFEVKVTKGQVSVVAQGDWHINKEFPWKLTVGDTKLDRTKFTLTEKDATVTNAPSGDGTVRGAVCSHDACHMIERDVTIP
jgi:hypothetical protein